MCKEYNGWSNYETWCVNLWLTNEEYNNQLMLDIVQGLNLYHASLALKDLVLENAPLDGASMYVDLLQAALDNVNWQEIIRVHEEDFAEV